MATKPNYSTEQRPIYKVEAKVPVPTKRYFKESKYPFGTMKVGESTLIHDKKYSTIVGTLRKYKLQGLKFTVRSVDGGLRVWRDQ